MKMDLLKMPCSETDGSRCTSACSNSSYGRSYLEMTTRVILYSLTVSKMSIACSHVPRDNNGVSASNLLSSQD